MKKLFLLLSLILCTASCSDDAEYTSEYSCFFMFDLNLHNTSIINNAVNPASMGVYARISSIPKNGVRCIVTELNDGKTREEELITTFVELNRDCRLGIANGIIVGNSTLGGGLYAYDAQCPNCIKKYGLYKYRLNWNNNGNWVACSNCGRKYDLNNNGFVVEGEKGLHLFRYRAYYASTQYGILLNVHN